MQYRVVWTKKMKGSSEFQVGLQALSQEKEAWGLSVAQQNQPSSQENFSRASSIA
jgi:hypothetical protein